MQTANQSTARKLEAAPKSRAASNSHDAPCLAPHPIRILIVDDDPDFLDLLTSEIQKIPGVSVDVAHHPDEALKMLTKRDFQLVVSDWALDSSNASEVLSTADHIRGIEYRAKPMHGKTPVMFISGSEKVTQTQILKRLKHFEPVSFLVKSCGAPLICLLATHILNRFSPLPEMEPC